MLQFKDQATRRFFFWCQNPKDDKDTSNCTRLDDLMNKPGVADAAMAALQGGGAAAGGAAGGGAAGAAGAAGPGGSLQVGDLQSILANLGFGGDNDAAGGAAAGGAAAAAAAVGEAAGGADAGDDAGEDEDEMDEEALLQVCPYMHRSLRGTVCRGSYERGTWVVVVAVLWGIYDAALGPTMPGECH